MQRPQVQSIEMLNTCWKKNLCYGLLITQGKRRSGQMKERPSWKLGLQAMESKCSELEAHRLQMDGFQIQSCRSEVERKAITRDRSQKTKDVKYIQRLEVKTRS
jgi:hypothetical protein